MLALCQRPKRAFSISTRNQYLIELANLAMCQRPKRAFSISTKGRDNLHLLHLWCQRPKRAFSISTKINLENLKAANDVSTP